MGSKRDAARPAAAPARRRSAARAVHLRQAEERDAAGGGEAAAGRLPKPRAMRGFAPGAPKRGEAGAASIRSNWYKGTAPAADPQAVANHG